MLLGLTKRKVQDLYWAAHDPTGHTSGMLFTNNGATCQKGTASPTNGFVRNVTFHQGITGKFQAEILYVSTLINQNYFSGIGNDDVNYAAGSNLSIFAQNYVAGIGEQGIGYNFSGTHVGIANIGNSTTGDIHGIVLDLVGQTVTIYRNGVLLHAAISLSGAANKKWYIAAYCNNFHTFTLNIGQNPFNFPIAGATPWG